MRFTQRYPAAASARYSTARVGIAALACVLALAACGSAAHEAVLARVGTTPITEQMVDRRAALASGDPSPLDRRRALTALIRAQWLIQEAASRHLSISPGELREQIRVSLLDGVPKATAAQVAGYYRAHRSAFLIPERRYFYIDNLKSEAAALKVKAQVESGRSFARMALDEERTSAQSFAPGREAIDRAILTARPNVLSGPFLLSDVGDHSLFEITRIVPSGYTPLLLVGRTIARQIVSVRQRHALAAFVRAWVVRWKARTSCAPAWVVRQCREYVGVSASETML